MVDKKNNNNKFIILWLVTIYVGWFALVYFGGEWAEVLKKWPIALSMALGSYFAGSTPMGGGTVGFPVLTLILDEAPNLGRDFSFAIQSVGMVSASIFIFCLSHPIAHRLLKWAIIGATIGTPIGVAFISPHVSGIFIQIFFAIIWAGFGILHIWKLNEFANYSGKIGISREKEALIGFLTGLISSLFIASILGVGVDLALYAVLVLVFRCDLRLAIPTSVILMAYTSVLGTMTQFLNGNLNKDVYAYWLAAAPIVAIGAPLGAIVVKKLGRKSTLWVVSILCLGQFLWTMIREKKHLGVDGWLLSTFLVLVFFGLFLLLYLYGSRLLRKSQITQSK